MSKVRLVLQARMSSSRLPGKMLMHIADMPLILLCAQRAASKGHELVVATSDEDSDDELVRCLKENNINVVRGSLDNVLERFILASEGLLDDDLIVRLTGDNPFVDGAFIDLILRSHIDSGHDYTRSLSPFDGLPYGVSAEVIRAGTLRALKDQKLEKEDYEHVTSYLTKKGEYHLFKSPLDKDYSHLRSTVDTKEDFELVSRVFDDISAPIEISWSELIQKLQALPGAAQFRTPYKKNGLKAQSILALGTVQLGLDYGIANKDGQPDKETAKEILNYAYAHGINMIDTASAYGSSEKLIGENFTQEEKQQINIHTKLDPLNDLDPDEIVNAVDTSIKNSCKNLGLDTLPCLMLHRWSHYSDFEGKVWQHLLSLKEDGKITKLGVSVQDCDEAIQALSEPQIEFMQIPYNICDWRWQESGFIDQRKKRNDIHIQARSVLLQGVYLLPYDRWPVLGQDAKLVADKLNKLMKEHKRESIQDLCYAYVRAQDWIDSIVVGAETLEQLKENLMLFNKTNLDNTADIKAQIPKVDIRFLNPAEWS